jgi:putative ABC transport system ATP-binding protein
MDSSSETDEKAASPEALADGSASKTDKDPYRSPAPAPKPIVKLRGISKTFWRGKEPVRVLENLDLDVPEGSFEALMGPSGSGKSTLLNLIAGIDEADRGAIRTAGLDVTAAGERARAAMRSRRLGFVFQAFHLLPTLTVAENVALPLELANAPAASIGPRVQELLQRIGLQDRAEAWPEVLSGGEQQRLAVARAVAARPAVLLCDEPTGNLDDTSAATVLELLAAMRREHGCSVVLVTHSSAAAAFCDRRLRLEGGVLHAQPAGAVR